MAPSREQLEPLAHELAREWVGPEATAEVISFGQSLACRVRAGARSFLLRIHSASHPLASEEYFSPLALESECAWLAALDAETDLGAQVPVAAPGGGYVAHVRGPEGDIPCTLLRWVEGAHLEDKPTLEQAGLLGALHADLHTHARTWTPPARFARPTIDAATWRLAYEHTALLVEGGVITGAQRGLLSSTLDLIERELAPLDAVPARVGLVHADLHGDNYLFHEGRPVPIDFGRASYAPWLYDLAECAASLAPSRRRALVEEYERHLPLGPGDLRRIEGYFLASLIEVFGNNASDPREREYLERAIPAWSGHFEDYVGGKPFLFGR